MLQNKVPEITLTFWVIKILSTTVGETVADALAVDFELGMAITASVMSCLLIAALVLQVRARRCIPGIYWFSVVLVSIVGTQLTDLLTDKLGVSLRISTIGFSMLLAAVFLVWYRTEGTLSIREVTTRRREAFYWCTILFTFALGTAAGDLATEDLGLGFRLGVVAFGAGLAATYGASRMGASTVATFWVAYILTRPLGAALGDLLAQAREYGGLGLGAKMTSALFLSVIVLFVTREQRRSNFLNVVETTP